MRLYHTTNAAEAILSVGFRDGEGYYGFVGLDKPLRGVFLSLWPADGNDGAKGDQVLEVTLPDDLDLEPIVEGDQPAWEYLVPAALINGRASVRLLTEDEVDEATARPLVQFGDDGGPEVGISISAPPELAEQIERNADTLGMSVEDFVQMTFLGGIAELQEGADPSR